MSTASSVFSRGGSELPFAVSARGAWVTDAMGRQYLDAAGGAITVGIGHGDPAVAAAMASQASSLDWVHASAFTTDPVEAYSAAVAALVPMELARVFPVSGGAEAMETALKMARAYHLARGEPERSVIIAR
ncbi:MAG TPA: aminotransferase class III-fold pyridoxal phosphate-dependent enzyme, partial [Acidimicrobiia bacterium]